MAVTMRVLYWWLYYELLNVGYKLSNFGRGVGRLLKHICGHLWERWMSRRHRSDRRRIVNRRVSDQFKKALHHLYVRRGIELDELNHYSALLADIDLHEPVYKPVMPNPIGVKNKIVGRLTQVHQIMGLEHPGMTVPEIKAKIKSIQRKERPKNKTRKFEVVKK